MTTCGLAVLLIGGPSDSSSQKTESPEQLREAAEQGDIRAQSNLGVMYAEGRGVPQNDAEAVRWFRKAAEQGYAEAQTGLGFMYALGAGVPQDQIEAARWWRKAAEQGELRAQYNLGGMYQRGRGVPRDYIEAHMWLNLAASRASGDDRKKYADARELVSRMMTAQQIAEAQRRAREWKPKTGEDKGGGPVK